MPDRKGRPGILRPKRGDEASYMLTSDPSLDARKLDTRHREPGHDGKPGARQCQHCHAWIMNPRTNQKYCDDACRRRAEDERRRNGRVMSRDPPPYPSRNVACPECSAGEGDSCPGLRADLVHPGRRERAMQEGHA